MTEEWKAFLDSQPITMTDCSPGEIVKRDENGKWECCRNLVTIRFGKSQVWAGEYSVGLGILARWIIDTRPPTWPIYLGPMTKGLRQDLINVKRTLTVTEILYHCAHKYRPELADVVESLFRDADLDPDGSYEEWSGDYGYSPDSRAGEAIYRKCRDIRRIIVRGIGLESFERGLAIAQNL